jgi:hypothetical protein
VAQARLQQDADVLIVKGIRAAAARALGPYQMVLPQYPQLVGDG